MTLPCPHCESRFNLDAALLKRGSVRLRCPSCGGVFVARAPRGPGKSGPPASPEPPPSGGGRVSDTRAARPGPGAGPDPAVSAEAVPGSTEPPDPSAAAAGQDGPDEAGDRPDAQPEGSAPEELVGEVAPAAAPGLPAQGSGEDPFEAEWERVFGERPSGVRKPRPPAEPPPLSASPAGRAVSRRKVASAFVLLAGCAVVLFCLSGLIGSRGRPGDEASGTSEAAANLGDPGAPAGPGPRAALRVSAVELEDPRSDSFLHAIRPFAPADTETSCQALLDLQEEVTGRDRPEPCLLFPPWIASLAMENSPEASLVCKWEAPYGLAVEGIRKGTLCPRGYAFLAAYYARKKLPDRALSFLREAQAAEPLDPWVRVAEVLYLQLVLRDREKAQEILHEIQDEPPVSALSRYLLACSWIRKGEYETAGETFDALARSFPEQVEFLRVRDTLGAVHRASHYSPEKARGILDLGVSFGVLRDDVMAEEICQYVLREMPDRLSVEGKKTAHLEMGRIHEARGDKLKASLSYRSALRLDPQFTEARQRIQALGHGGPEHF